MLSGSEDHPTLSVSVTGPPLPDGVGFTSSPAWVHASSSDKPLTATTAVPDRNRNVRRLIGGDGRFIVLIPCLLPGGSAAGRRRRAPTRRLLYSMLCMRSGT